MEESTSVTEISFSSESKPFKKNANKKYEELNQIVVKYKEEKKDKDLLAIINLTKNLINKVLKDYNIQTFPQDVYEEIAGNSFTLVLLKTIDTYEYDKGSFSTHLTWKLRSYVAGKKRDHTKRKHMYRTIPLVEHPDTPEKEWDLQNGCQPHLTSRETRFYHSKKKIMNDWAEGRTSGI